MNTTDKWWHLKDPNGNEYKFQGGLSKFLKDNPSLFHPSDLMKKGNTKCNAYIGLANLRPENNYAKSWRDWTWNWAKKYNGVSPLKNRVRRFSSN